MLAMREWPFAFRAWAIAYFGDRWTDRTVDLAWVRAYKLAFRAGFRAARRASLEIGAEDELVGRLRAHMLHLHELAATLDDAGARRLRAIVADLGIAVDLLAERPSP